MATTMLNIYDTELKKTAILQNAYNITETRELNQIYSLTFTVPAKDEKVQYIQPFHFARWGEDGELYRIIKTELSDSDTPVLNVTCEHVIATLVDDLMFGAVTYGGSGVKTSAVINYLLNKQTTKHWVLAECDFDRRFEYLWEQENILNALYSIPREFTKAYQWKFDTTTYPWRLSLKAIDSSIHPEYYIRAKRNLLSSGTVQDYAGICTRIYPLGYGEGVNQLTIKDVNGGVPYLQSPSAIIAQYGIKQKVLVDRRYENAEALKEYAQTMLDALQTPSMTRTFDVVDLYPLTSQDIDNADVGKIVKMTGDDTIAYVTKTVRVHDDAGNLQIDLSTKATDVASTIADLADRVRIETVYAQGATQLYQHSKDENATSTKGMHISLYFPSEMRQINKVLMKLKLGKFRSYSQATEAAAKSTQTTTAQAESTRTTTSQAESTRTTTAQAESTRTTTAEAESTRTTTAEAESTQTTTVQAEYTRTTTSEAETTPTTSSMESEVGTTEVSMSSIAETTGGGGGQSSSAEVSVSGSGSTSTDWTGSSPTFGVSGSTGANYGGDSEHYHDFDISVAIPYYSLAHSHTFSFSAGSHSHSFSIPEHSHSIYIPGHSHDVTIPAHDHTVTIPAHDHEVTIPSHSHDVTIPSHSHNVTIPSHSHSVTIPAHSHNVTIPAHSHKVDIPAHSHSITAGIFESGNPTAFGIYVGGTLKATVNATSYNDDITSWLLQSDNTIPRDSWIDVEIRPNDLAYVQTSVFVQGFVQSRGGGNY